MNTIQSLLSKLIKPLQHHFYFFFTILLLHSAIDLAYLNTWLSQTVGVFCHGLVVAYLLTIPCLFLERRKPLFTAYKAIIFTLYILSFWIDIICHATIGTSLNINIVSAILATNTNEALECIQTYFSFTPLIVGTLLLGIICFIYRYLKHHPIRSVVFHAIWMVCIASGLYMALFSQQINHCGPLAHLGGPFGKALLFCTNAKPIDLRANLVQPDLAIDSQKHPQNIVMIIGESLTKHHCSTYGYPKPTCPRLEQLEKDSLLHTFTSVKSPDVYTLPTFQRLFYKNRQQGPDSLLAWYQTPNLLDIATRSGYRTYWLSNQSKSGFLDNVIGKIADFCTERHFVQLVGNHLSYDGELIKYLRPIIDQRYDKNLYIIHFMGSHTLFNQRFPSSRAHFTASDYADKPSHQRQILADYDNSVLYNDSVVNEICRTFRDEEAIIFYFPDHGVDLYQTSPDYYGHANGSSASIAFGKQIPFYIYTTDRYKQNYPDRVRTITQVKDQPVCTDRMIYTVMDLMGTTFSGNREVQDSTILVSPAHLQISEDK